MYCKDCEHFKKDKDRSGIGECLSGKIKYSQLYPQNDEMTYFDREDYSASHWVGINFGCIHFQKAGE